MLRIRPTAAPAQRRELVDLLGVEDQLLQAAAAGPARFGDLVAAASLPAVGRAHALHLIWHRRLAIDLSQPLDDDSVVSLATAEVLR